MDEDSALSPLERCLKTFIEPAATFLAIQHVYGSKVRAESLKAFGKLVDAHILTTGVLGAVLLRANGRFTEYTPTSTRRAALFASFAIGLDVCERAICEGRYLQAKALLRQQVETLATLHEVASGTRKDGKTANIKTLEPSIARLYGELSEAAHVSKHGVVRDATELSGPWPEAPGPAIATRYFPAFDADSAKNLYALHIYTAMRLVEQLSLDFAERHPNTFTDQEIQAIELAVDLMVEEGMLVKE